MNPVPSALDAVRQRFAALAAPLDVHPSYKRFATAPTDDGGAHAEYDGVTYAYVVTERGRELERRESADADELLYWLIADATRQAASVDEMRHRDPVADPRRRLFATHVRLLAAMRAEWGVRKQREYDAIVVRHPFNDAGG